MARADGDYSPVEFEPSYSPEMDQADLSAKVENVWACFQEARNHDKQYKKDWDRWYRLYEGRHWSVATRDWQSTPVINLCFSAVETICPILTDSRPQCQVVPRTPESERIALVLGHIVDWLWEANDCDIKLPSTVKNMLIFGSGFWKIVWDPSARGGLGDVRIFEVDPVNVFISPYARRLEEAEYVIHAENIPRRMVARMYPQLSPESKGVDEPSLTPDRSITNQDSMGSKTGGEFMQLTDGSGFARVGRDSSGYDEGGDRVTVLEKWERREDGSIWQVVVVNHELVLERPSPFQHGRFPFVHFRDNDRSWSVWPSGELQHVERLQIEINRRRGHIMDILRYTANPMLVVDPSLIGDFDQLEARPNLVIPAEGGLASVGWLQPPSIPNALFQVNALDKEDFDAVLGKTDILSGRKPPDIEAGVALDIMQEAASVRMRLKVRNIENALRRAGELQVALVQQFYTTERVFKIVGSELMGLEKPLTQDGFMAINQPDPNSPVDPETGMPTIINNEIPTLAEAEFDVRIGAGSTLPVSKSMEFQKAIGMYQMQLADDAFVWKKSGTSQWQEELLKGRMYWAQKMAQQAEMQAAAAVPAEEELPSEGELDVALESEGAPVQPEQEGAY